jgi:hypothetical protein
MEEIKCNIKTCTYENVGKAHCRFCNKYHCHGHLLSFYGLSLCENCYINNHDHKQRIENVIIDRLNYEEITYNDNKNWDEGYKNHICIVCCKEEKKPTKILNNNFSLCYYCLTNNNFTDEIRFKIDELIMLDI